MKGITKKQILDSPEGQALYQRFLQSRMSGKGRMKGKGLWDNFVQFLKDSKILSKVGDVLLPVAGGALAGLATANPAGIAAGAAAGSAGAQWLKSQGFGRKRKGGCMSCLVISPNGQRLGQKGKGLTISQNGTYQNTKMPQTGRGGSVFGTVSSEFGQIKF